MLNRRIAIYVPSTVKGNLRADPALINKWVKAAKIKLATLFGGFTATPGVGGWVSPEHGLIEEAVTIVASHTDDDGINKHLPAVKEFALAMATALQQEAVTVQVDNGLDFVSVPPAVAVNVI